MSQQDAGSYQEEVYSHVLTGLRRDDEIGQVKAVELRGTFPESEVVVTFTTYAGREVTTRYPIWQAWWNNVDEWEHAGEVAGYLETAIIEDLASPPQDGSERT